MCEAGTEILETCFQFCHERLVLMSSLQWLRLCLVKTELFGISNKNCLVLNLPQECEGEKRCMQH